MRGRFWRLAAGALALALGLRCLWSLGVLNALAARLEPEMPLAEVVPEPAQEPAAQPLPDPTPRT